MTQLSEYDVFPGIADPQVAYSHVVYGVVMVRDIIPSRFNGLMLTGLSRPEQGRKTPFQNPSATVPRPKGRGYT